MADVVNFPYIHGYSPKEQERLRRQARFGEQLIFSTIDFSRCQNALEVGCGVGAQAEILLRRFPNLNLTGIDLNEKQIQSAKDYFQSLSFAQGRYQFEKMSADKMSFEDQHFEGAFICWVLEHVPNPVDILTEVHRVLKPKAPIYVTEVLNSSFFLDPYSPNTWKYWQAFNDYQYEQAGDPFVGAKLGNLLQAAKFNDIQTLVKTFHFDNRQPTRRKEAILFWSDLLMSGAQELLNAGCVDQEVVDGMEKELHTVANDPNAVFYYSFIQAIAKV